MPKPIVHHIPVCPSIQLSEHQIDLDSGRLEAAVRGVLEDPARGFFMVLQVDANTVGAAYVSFIWALDLEIDAGHERVRSLYGRHGFEELPRRRLVRRLSRRAGA